VEISITDDGIEMSSADGNGVIRWDNIIKWRENHEFVLIYQSLAHYLIVPKRIKNDGFDLEYFVKILRRKVGNAT